MHPIFLDTETTGLSNTPRLVQLAYKDSATGKVVNELFNPPIAIEYGAMAIHHITQEMVEGKPAFDGSKEKADLIALLEQTVLVAHNAPFDINILKNEGVATMRSIDTCRVSQHVLDSDSHSLQYLRYSLHLKVESIAIAHDALGDILVLEALYNHLVPVVKEKYGITDEQELLQKMEALSTMPILMESFPFGKYIGRTFSDIASADRGYLEWLFKSEASKPEGDQNQNLIHTLKTHLGLLI